MRRLVWFALAACSLGRGRETREWQGPEVDLTCVDKARRGELLVGLPAEIGGFRVIAHAAEGRVLLVRDGRHVDDATAQTVYRRALDERTPVHLSLIHISEPTR